MHTTNIISAVHMKKLHGLHSFPLLAVQCLAETRVKVVSPCVLAGPCVLAASDQDDRQDVIFLYCGFCDLTLVQSLIIKDALSHQNENRTSNNRTRFKLTDWRHTR